MKLQVDYIPITQLTSFSRNSKIHTKKQIKHIASSIRKFGFNDPLAIAGENNTILEGNGRVEAAKLLGMTELPCLRLDHLEPEEQRAYVIAHNALCLETGFDDAVLFSELEALKDYDFGDYGLNTAKYMTTLENLQRKALTPVTKAHYLISLDVNMNDRIIDMIAAMRNMEGVEVRATCN
ncbi:MAG: ParB/Srx family N-terminal domain-containing protein [Oscillospiraceae bacterium]|nr:ParB/Srx family N-terminal domain-containing protein [Oscillospiraceae bacterium]